MTATILEIQTAEQKAAEAIQRYAEAAIAKINENAGALFSRYVDANERAEALCKGAEKQASHLLRTVDIGKDSAVAVTKSVKDVEKKLASFMEQAEDIDVRLRIARSKADSMLELNGKTVRLKSGGHLMTAAGFADDGGVLCLWAVEGEVFEQSIPAIALEVAVADT
jgi:uncharacterized protein YodC (DUF2158 family)